LCGKKSKIGDFFPKHHLICDPQKFPFFLGINEKCHTKTRGSYEVVAPFHCPNCLIVGFSGEESPPPSSFITSFNLVTNLGTKES
jgi:hypothetical protein